MDAPVQGVITIVEVIGLVGAPLLALITGFITKMSTPPKMKALILLTLAVADGALTEYLANPEAFDWRWALMKAGSAFLIATAAHFGLLKPTGVSDKVLGMGVKDPPAQTSVETGLSGP